MQPENQEDREQLERLLEIADDDYIYRLVGVNIHSGTVSSGHYWSFINTRRGTDEPASEDGDDSEWKRSVDSNWLEFNDSVVREASMDKIKADAIGGGSSSSSYYESSGSGKSAYMLIYEKKRKKSVREVEIQDESKDATSELVRQLSGTEVETFIPVWIKEIV